MGTSTDAILAFGFDLGEELPESLEAAEDEGFDFDEWLAAKLGLPEWREGMTDDERTTHYATKRAAIEAFPVDLITHCSYDCPMYFLAVRGTETSARRGYPQEVATPEIDPEKLSALRAFCEQNNIEWSEPKWQIFSLWG